MGTTTTNFQPPCRSGSSISLSHPELIAKGNNSLLRENNNNNNKGNHQ